jgi:hypothetical protein
MNFPGLAIRAALLKSMLRKRLWPGYTFSEMPFHMRGSFGETIPCTQALFESDQIDRVRACAFGKSLADEVSKLSATSFVERSRIAFDLGPSIIAGGQIFSQDHPFFLSWESPLKAGLGAPEQFEQLNLVSSLHGLTYFGHWLRDDCPLYEAVREEGETRFLTLPNWADRRLYQPTFGHSNYEVRFAHVQQLTLHSEQGFNLDKARRIRLLRDRLRDKHKPQRDGHVVYLSRSTGPNTRDMNNRDAVETAMEQAGIRVVHPGSDPQRLVDEMLDARMIITVEGSQAAHGAYMLQPGGAMLILQTPYRFYNPHHEWARLLGMHYGTVIGTPTEEGYDIDPSEVLHMMDRLLQRQDAAQASLNAVNEKTPPSRVSARNTDRQLKNK